VVTGESGSDNGGTFIASLNGVNGGIKWISQEKEDSNDERITAISIDDAANVYVVGQQEHSAGIADRISVFLRK